MSRADSETSVAERAAKDAPGSLSTQRDATSRTRLFAAVALLSIAALLGGLALWSFLSRAEDSPPTERETKNRGDQADASVNDGIPFETMYGTSTFGREDIKYARRAGVKSIVVDLNSISRESGSIGASNVCLVLGDDLAEGINATRMVFAGGRSADSPASRERTSTSRQYWMVAYFGVSHRGPAAWAIESVKQNGNAFRVSFTRPKADGTTADTHQYFLWVPVGELEAGQYELELFNADAKRLTLMRRVAVTARSDK